MFKWREKGSRMGGGSRVFIDIYQQIVGSIESTRVSVPSLLLGPLSFIGH